jgi:hypothetical protein
LLDREAGKGNERTIRSIANGASMTIYPNPAYHNFSLQIAEGKPGRVTVRAFNLLGESTWQKSYQLDGINQVYSIDTQSWMTGMYDIQVLFEDGSMLSQQLELYRP